MRERGTTMLAAAVMLVMAACAGAGSGGVEGEVVTPAQHEACASACGHLQACGASDGGCVERCEGGVVQKHEACVRCRTGTDDCGLLESGCAELCRDADGGRGESVAGDVATGWAG